MNVTGWNCCWCPGPLVAQHSMLGLADLVLDVGLGSLRLVVFGDFNFHAEASEDKPPQDLLVAMGMSQVIWGRTQGQTQDRNFCSFRSEVRENSNQAFVMDRELSGEL